MMDSFILIGKWWTPSSRNLAIKGRMAFDPFKGAVLDLDGLLREGDTCAVPFQVLLGETEDGRAITLVGSSDFWLTHSYRFENEGLPETPTGVSLCAKVLIIGKHYQTTQNISFTSFSIDFSHLSDWARLGDGPDIDRSVTTIYQPHNDIGGFGRLVIESERGSCQLSISPERVVGLDAGIEMIRQLRNLIALFVHRPVQEVRVRGKTENGMMVDIFYPSFARDRNAYPLRANEMLLPLGMIGTELGSIVDKWFLANETMAQVIDLYFAASLGGDLFPETRFLMYMQAIEAYHRIRFRNFEVDPEEHAKRLSIILSSIPEEYREWMRDGLEYSNEPSIGQRLKETYRDFKDITDGFVDDRKMFIYRLIKTRNRLTHMEGDGDEATFRGNDLELATMRLRLLLELCLMKEIGITTEQMKSAVEKNTMFSIIKDDPMDKD